MIRFAVFIALFITTFNLDKAEAKPLKMKLAVLENLKLEKLSTDKYANDYWEGLNAAIATAKEDGIEIEMKAFIYEKEPLAILKQIPDVKAWNPDLIIGPRSSSLFLLLKDQFKDVLVLSPFATAEDIASMPENFYSLTFSNKYFTQAVVNLVAEKFKGKGVAPIGEVDCKNCMNFIEEFSSVAKSLKLEVRETVPFVSNAVETTPPEKLLVNYRPGDVILLPNTSYTSGTLVVKLADYLKDKSLVFIGGDGWGDWTTSYVGKLSSKNRYSAYRVTPWSLDAKDERITSFLKNFKRHRHTEPTGAGSLLSYATLTAAIATIAPDQLQKDQSPRQLIWESFRKRRRLDPNYARPKKYVVYKVTQDGEKFDGEVSPILRSQP